jgi:hypothetical protein
MNHVVVDVVRTDVEAGHACTRADSAERRGQLSAVHTFLRLVTAVSRNQNCGPDRRFRVARQMVDKMISIDVVDPLHDENSHRNVKDKAARIRPPSLLYQMNEEEDDDEDDKSRVTTVTNKRSLLSFLSETICISKCYSLVGARILS